MTTAPAQPGQFRLLIRHLLGRFFNNEMISIGGEALPLIMTVAGVIAVPTLMVSVALFPAYHAFPPKPPIPDFWTQAGEHYFFTMYSFVAMGAVTVFEADLLFPNSLDIFILSPLPIPDRRLVVARVSAVLIFLALFLLGANSFGIVAYPMATELDVPRMIVAHLASVAAAGTFASALFVALQGLLICTLGGRMYRAASTILQGVSVALLMTVLFFFLTLSRSLQPLILSGGPAVRSFPSFWFLGIYECILAGPARLAAFAHLARTGCWATSLAVLVATATYPLAYRRRTRQAIEGPSSRQTADPLGRPLASVLHATVLRTPARRAVYHFIGQTLRTPRHRVYLAIYAGLGMAMMTACAAVLRVEAGQISVAFSAYGLRLAVPGLAFWTIAGLCTALDSPADPRGGWIFRVIDGKPTLEQLDAVRIWVTVGGLAVTWIAVALLHCVSPPPLQALKPTLAQLLAGTGLCVLSADAFLLTSAAIPFTETRIPPNTGLAFVLLRYIVAFPAVVLLTVRCEPWMETGARHLLTMALLLAAAHAALCLVHRRILLARMGRPEVDEANGLIQSLGLHS